MKSYRSPTELSLKFFFFVFAFYPAHVWSANLDFTLHNPSYPPPTLILRPPTFSSFNLFLDFHTSVHLPRSRKLHRIIFFLQASGILAISFVYLIKTLYRPFYSVFSPNAFHTFTRRFIRPHRISGLYILSIAFRTSFSFVPFTYRSLVPLHLVLVSSISNNSPTCTWSVCLARVRSAAPKGTSSRIRRQWRTCSAKTATGRPGKSNGPPYRTASPCAIRHV